MRFSDTQQQAIDSRNQNVIVSASAGSGKTSVLVERLCTLVLDDQIPIDNLLAMTFTKDAAGEMKDRLRSRLQEALSQGKNIDYISTQLAFLETADISTIDSFCLSVVQNYYYLDKSLTLTMTKQAASQALQEQLLLEAYHAACKEMDTQELADLLSFYYTFGKKDEHVRDEVRTLMNIANAKPEPKEWLTSIEQGENKKEIDIWFNRYLSDLLFALKELYKQCADWHEEFQNRLVHLEQCIEHYKESGYSTLLKAFEIFMMSQKKMPGVKKLDGIDPSLYKVHKDYITEIENKIMECLFPEEIYQQDSQQLAPIYACLCKLCMHTMDIYQTLKKKHEVLDFNDMSHFAYDLINKNTIVRDELKNKYAYILVDEFQDTNQLQESIINLISNGHNVFRVGDVKQAIYGFRQAKPDIMKSHLNDSDDQVIIMDQNFRSNKSIIDFNNDFYSKIMNTIGLEPQFFDTDIANVGSDAQQQEPQVPIRYLYLEKDKEEEKRKESAYTENRYDIIAQDILKKHQSGIEYKDICILSRNRGVHEPIRDALEAYGIPVLAEINHGFYTNAAVQIVLSTLQALLNPMDDIALTSALLSPIGDVKIEQLANIPVKRGVPLYLRIKEEPFMDKWHELETHRYESVTQLVQSIYAFDDFYQNHTTITDKTNLDVLLEKASQYPEQNEVLSFIQAQQLDAQQDSEAEAFPYGKDANVVRIKTMHQSKGLQFPVVYLLGYNKTDSFPPHCRMDDHLGIGSKVTDTKRILQRKPKEYLAVTHKQNLDSIYEEMRIFYVATTRAQKECVIVDSIKSMELFQTPLTLAHLLKNVNYSRWILHTYHGISSNLIHFESHPFYDRPKNENQNENEVEITTYAKESVTVETITASSLKQKQTWKPFEITSKRATQRGTLFHEIMGQCSYPFNKEQVIDFSKTYGYDLSATDLKQIVALNENEQYAKWMKENHEFECSYIIEKNKQIVHGFMDLVIWEDNQTIILDYKTDTVDNAQELVQRYKVQLQTYKEAMMICDDSKPIQTYIYSFHLNELIAL